MNSIPPLRIVCLHSLTAHGVVGLKPFLALLGEAVLPVPSLLLTGPGDMPGCRRFEYDFAAMLEGTLAAVAARGETAVVFVGYLGSAEQVAVVERALERHRAAVSGLVVDPVCGDNGRAYVAPALLDAWPRLLAPADWALPNVTELELLTGAEGEAGVARFQQRFPGTRLVVTGWIRDAATVTRLYRTDGSFEEHAQPQIPGRFNGTGDLFAAAWMRAMYLRGLAPGEAMYVAAETVGAALRASAAAGSRELLLAAMSGRARSCA